MVFKKIKLTLTLVVCFFFFTCGNEKEKKSYSSLKATNLSVTFEKIKGISFVSPNFLLEQSHFTPIQELGANWVSNMPFGMIKKGSAEVRFNLEWQWASEKEEGVLKAVKAAKEKGLKVMLKPQLWGHDIFTGTFGFEKDKDWQSFENDYLDFILFYAKIAADSKVDMYCIGTELARFVKARPKFWEKLIEEVKKVYNGKLTYAENWDAVEVFPFWNLLDFIGSDAYYPISDKKYPSVSDFIEGWEPWKQKLKQLSKELNKPILFTEWGYRSTVYNGLKPWDYSENLEVSQKNQLNAYTAVFETLYNEDWFAGGFLWKWFPYPNSGGPTNDRFTPQNKLAEEKLRSFFKKSVNQ